MLRPAWLALVALVACDGSSTPEAAPLPEGTLEVRDVGFQTPESVLHDSVADVYLVSNINGGGRDRDDNGFISRVSPDGEVLELKWIDGADAEVSLSAPKGSAIIGDSLFVADIDSIRIFDRNSGAALGAIGVPNAAALNDLAVAADGTLWFSDMGSEESAASTGLTRRNADGSLSLVATGEQIDGPNGVVAYGDGVAVAGFRGRTLRAAGAGGPGATLAELDGSQLDGLVALPDSSLLVSSWEAQAIFRVAPDGSSEVVVAGLRTPADIGYDARRGRVLVPSFEGNWLRIQPLP